jgi:hypothetical protein
MRRLRYFNVSAELAPRFFGPFKITKER